MLPTLHIRAEAFLTMLWTAAEVFKKECLGTLWGYKPTPGRNHFLVTDALAVQHTRRRLNTEVEQSRRSSECWQQIFGKSWLDQRFIGDFHSHPEWGPYLPQTEPSGFDVALMTKNKSGLKIIISITSRKIGRANWETLEDGSIKGSLGKLNFHFNAYTLLENGGKSAPQRLQLVAPKAIRWLNRMNTLDKKSR